MPALNGALAFTEMDHVALRVAEDLNLDVSRSLDCLFQVERRVTKSSRSFGLRSLKCGTQIRLCQSRVACLCHHHPQPLSTSPDNQTSPQLHSLLQMKLSGSTVPGTIGTPASTAARRALVFEPMISIASALGPIKVKPAAVTARANSALSARKP